MIINEQGKLFGKISIIDIAILLCAIVFIGAIAVRFVMPSKFGETMQTYTYTSTVKDVRKESVDAITNSVGKVWYDEKGTDIGTLKDIKVSEFENLVTKTDGSVVTAKVPSKYVVEMEFEATALEGNSSVLLGGKREVSNGSNLMISTENITVTGTISDLLKK